MMRRSRDVWLISDIYLDGAISEVATHRDHDRGGEQQHPGHHEGFEVSAEGDAHGAVHRCRPQQPRAGGRSDRGAVICNPQGLTDRSMLVNLVYQ
jgi:hypothetical protein